MLSLMFCMAIAMFSCTDPDFDKDYTLIDAGLNVTATLDFGADAATQDVTFAAAPEGSVWGYRKSGDWISVTQYNNKLSISVSLWEGMGTREGAVILVKEAAGGKSVEAGTITVKQGSAVTGNWDTTPVEYSWEWNEKDTVTVALASQWSDTTADGAYKYAYKIIGEGASGFVQTETDTVRAQRTIKLTTTKENTDKEKDVVAYFIVTDKAGTKIYVRRELTIKYRTDNFIVNPQEVVVSASKAEVEVEVTSLNKKADDIQHKLAFKDGGAPDWIVLPADTLKGDGKFKITINANDDAANARTDTVELVQANGTSFNPPVYLTVKQNQKPVY
jgi:hypothetical protein